jgi:hypothetical protein
VQQSLNLHKNEVSWQPLTSFSVTIGGKVFGYAQQLDGDLRFLGTQYELWCDCTETPASGRAHRVFTVGGGEPCQGGGTGIYSSIPEREQPSREEPFKLYKANLEREQPSREQPFKLYKANLEREQPSREQPFKLYKANFSLLKPQFTEEIDASTLGYEKASPAQQCWASNPILGVQKYFSMDICGYGEHDPGIPDCGGPGNGLVYDERADQCLGPGFDPGTCDPVEGMQWDALYNACTNGSPGYTPISNRYKWKRV